MRFFISLIIFTTSTFTFAEDFYWIREGFLNPVKYPSPQAVCGGNTLLGTPGPNVSRMSCGIKDMTGWIYTSFPIIRLGDGCEHGMNNSDFSCNPPPPEPPTCENGQVLNSDSTACRDKTDCENKFGESVTFSLPGNYSGFTANVDGCAVAMETPGDCSVTIAGTLDICKWTGSHMGQSFGEGEDGNGQPAPDPSGSDSDFEDSTKPTTDSSQSCTNRVFDAEGRMSYNCNTTSSAAQSGKCKVGTVNGSLVCIAPQSPPSQSQTKSRDDAVTQTPTSDGGTSTQTDTTNTTTTCKAGSCNTVTNNSTTVVVKDGNGNTTGETTTCKGQNCPGSENLPSEEEVGGMPGSVTMPGVEGGIPEIGEDSDKNFEDATSDYYARILNAPIVQAVTDISLPSGGSCSFGSANIFGGSVSFNHFCELSPQILQGLTYVFLAIWAWAAIRLFFSA